MTATLTHRSLWYVGFLALAACGTKDAGDLDDTGTSTEDTDSPTGPVAGWHVGSGTPSDERVTGVY